MVGSEIELGVHKSCSAWRPSNQSAGQLIASALQVLMFALPEVRAVRLCTHAGVSRRAAAACGSSREKLKGEEDV